MVNRKLSDYRSPSTLAPGPGCVQTEPGSRVPVYFCTSVVQTWEYTLFRQGKTKGSSTAVLRTDQQTFPFLFATEEVLYLPKGHLQVEDLSPASRVL